MNASLSTLAAMFGFLGILATGDASACDAQYDPDAPNLPTKVGAQCSFENAGKGNGLGGDHQLIWGQVVKKQGAELTTQIVSFSSFGCNTRQIVLITDCAKPGVIAVEGVARPADQRIAGGDFTYAELAIGAKGKVRLSTSMSLVDMALKAQSAGLNVHQDANELFADLEPHDQFDLLCGCKLYHPESAGARE